MKKFDKLQIVVIIISVIAIAVTAVQVATMNTEIKEESLSKYKASIDSVKKADDIYIKFKSSKLLANRDIGNFKVRTVKKVTKKVVKTKKIETYWMKTGIELYKKDTVAFSMFFDGKATFNINGKSQKFKVGDKLAVGKIILKQKFKGTNKFTGNTKFGENCRKRV